MGFIIFAIAYVIFVPVVLVVCLIPVMKERKLSNGIRNQDVFSQNYLFKVNFSKCDFLKRMNTKNGYDILEYTFDTEAMTITFLKYGVRMPYTVLVKEFGNGCYIRLQKSTSIFGRGVMPYQMIEFMQKKCDAELLPYEAYKDIVV
jgi:hypothetical protein